MRGAPIDPGGSQLEPAGRVSLRSAGETEGSKLQICKNVIWKVRLHLFVVILWTKLSSQINHPRLFSGCQVQQDKMENGTCDLSTHRFRNKIHL